MARRNIDIRQFADNMRRNLAEILDLDEAAVAHVLAKYDHSLAAILLDVVAGPARAAEVGNPPRQKRFRKARRAAQGQSSTPTADIAAAGTPEGRATHA